MSQKHYQFKQAVKIGRHTFPLGIREVPAEIEKHPHFKLFLQAGSVKVAGAADVDKKLSDLKPLPIASSTAAARSRQQASIVQKQGDVAPEALVGESAPSKDEAGAQDLGELPELKAAGQPAADEAEVSPDAEIGGGDEAEAEEAQSGKKKKGKGK